MMQRQLPDPLDYANFVPIIQSSGTGKSRTIHEMSKLVFTIPFNLREAGTTGMNSYVVFVVEFTNTRSNYIGFPEADAVVRDYLMKPSQTATKDHLLRFFDELFRAVENVLTYLSIPSPSSNLAQAWFNYLKSVSGSNCSKRSRLYESVVNAAIANASAIPSGPFTVSDLDGSSPLEMTSRAKCRRERHLYVTQSKTRPILPMLNTPVSFYILMRPMS